MANKTKPIKIHGIDVTQIELQGKYYTPVAARVKIAQQVEPEAVRAPGGGFHVVSHSIIPVADRWAFTCVVEYPVGSGVHTCGSDFIDVRDATGLAKAETSAIGRALSMHGIDIEGGIASAEEMERVDAAPAAAEDAYLPPARADAIVEDSWSKLDQRRESLGISDADWAAARKTYNTVAKMASALDRVEKRLWEGLRMRANEIGMDAGEYEFHLQETGGNYLEMQAVVETFAQRDLRMLKGGKAGVH